MFGTYSCYHSAPTIFNKSFSYLVQPLTWVGAWTILIIMVVYFVGSFGTCDFVNIERILPKGPFPPFLRMADRALLAGYPPYILCLMLQSWLIITIEATLFHFFPFHIGCNYWPQLEHKLLAWRVIYLSSRVSNLHLRLGRLRDISSWFKDKIDMESCYFFDYLHLCQILITFTGAAHSRIALVQW